jgi:hypothetical protein
VRKHLNHHFLDVARLMIANHCVAISAAPAIEHAAVNLPSSVAGMLVTRANVFRGGIGLNAPLTRSAIALIWKGSHARANEHGASAGV